MKSLSLNGISIVLTAQSCSCIYNNCLSVIRVLLWTMLLWTMAAYLLVLWLLQFPAVYGDTLCVANNSSETSSNCHNLSYYTDDPSLYFSTDTTLIFLEGVHYLYEPVTISGVSNLTLQGEGVLQDGSHWTVRESTVVIHCSNSEAGLFFVNSSVNISKISFYNCGTPVESETLESQFEPYYDGLYKIRFNFESYINLQATLIFFNSTNVNLDQVSLQECSGFCIFTLNTQELMMLNVYISHSSQNTLAEYKCCSEESSKNPKCTGGNMILFYLDSDSDVVAPSTKNYTLSIYDSIFSFGAGPPNNHTQAQSTMSSITVIDITVHYVTIFLDSVTLFENLGGNFAAISGNSWIGLYNVTSEGANRYACSGTTPMVSFDVSITNQIGFSPNYMEQIEDVNHTVTIGIDECRFFGNIAQDSSGINIDTSLIVPFLPIKSKYYAYVLNSVFSQNRGSFGSCIGAGGTTPVSAVTLILVMVNMTFDENYYRPKSILYDTRNLTNPYRNVPPCCLALGNVVNATFVNVNISNHNTLGVYAYNTRMIFIENNEIRNNTGVQGGGMMLLGTSAIVMFSSVLRFIDNKAERGAAIFITPPVVSSYSYPFCQYQVDGSLNGSSSIVFSGNIASITGDIIYGGDVDNCFLFTNFGITVSDLNINGLFVYEEEINPRYSISSDAIKVCFCFDEESFCNVSNITTSSIYPGESVNVSVATVGDTDAYTTGKIKILHEGANVKTVSNELPRCFNLSIGSSELTRNSSNNTLTLVIDGPYDSDDVTSISIVVPILSCPPGFRPLGSSCTCDAAIETLGTGVVCSIEDQLIYHRDDAWIGYSNTSNCVLVSDHCPFDYCKNSNVSFNIYQPDAQCALDRSGVLCGGCAEGFSIKLGSNECGQCSNSYLSLLLVFGIAGVVLVIFLILLNLTVTIGTINGLIFYANIVKVNQPIFFPNGPVTFLSQFIAWLNLDLGIETCFYNGMTPTQKVWWQFAFPFYIWIIIVSVIIACKYSKKIASLVSSNAVPVLATLFLLSYVKIIRTYILALKVSKINCGSAVNSVWAVDGNISYFGDSHIWLFLFSILVLLVAVIPYTIFIIILPLLERYPRVCGKVWLSFLKPISDAYCGPFKDKFRFWAGLLLLIRLIIANTVPFLPQTGRLLLIIFFVSFLIFFFIETGGPYKLWYLNLLDVWFFVQLLCLSALALSGDSEIGTIVSVSLSFVTFLIIMAKHIFCRLIEYTRFKRLKPNLISSSSLPKVTARRMTEPFEPRSVSNDYNRYRDSILDLADED